MVYLQIYPGCLKVVEEGVRACGAGNLSLSPRVSSAQAAGQDLPTSPRHLTTFTTWLHASDAPMTAADSRHPLLHDRYKRLSLSGYDAYFSTAAAHCPSCVVVDQCPAQLQSAARHDSSTTVPAVSGPLPAPVAVGGHYERLQLNAGPLGGGSMDRQRRLQLISNNPVMSLRRFRTMTSQSGADDDDNDDVRASEVDQLRQFAAVDQQVAVY